MFEIIHFALRNSLTSLARTNTAFKDYICPDVMEVEHPHLNDGDLSSRSLESFIELDSISHVTKKLLVPHHSYRYALFHPLALCLR